MTVSAIDVLKAARLIANNARSEGVLIEERYNRHICEHLGAVLADSVLQAGLSYNSVVRPRVQMILRMYPSCHTISSLSLLIKDGKVSEFLNWSHPEKLTRFEELVAFLHKWGVEDLQDLRQALVLEEFCEEIQSVRGIGPKTVDYMACLVGIESIAVDRHVRAFAKSVGVENNSYQFLRASFCCAADLLSLSRREFDSWLWRRVAMPTQVQLPIEV